MDQQSVKEVIVATYWPRVMAASALGMLAIFLFVVTISALKSYSYIGTGVAAGNTFTVTGEGYVYAVPDTATFSAGVDVTAADVQTAQTKATTAGNAIIDYLKAQGVADADIQTTDYEINPQYSYQTAACPEVASSNGAPIYCPPGRQTLTGYEVTETLSVKVRDTSKAGTLLAGVGSKGATNVSGLSFTVDNPDDVQAQARDKAISQAKDKADALAKALGVEIVRVVGFQENQNGGIVPMYAKASAGMALDSAAPTPTIQPGQNKITDDVTVTYEIR